MENTETIKKSKRGAKAGVKRGTYQKHKTDFKIAVEHKFRGDLAKGLLVDKKLWVEVRLKGQMTIFKSCVDLTFLDGNIVSTEINSVFNNNIVRKLCDNEAQRVLTSIRHYLAFVESVGEAFDVSDWLSLYKSKTPLSLLVFLAEHIEEEFWGTLMSYKLKGLSNDIFVNMVKNSVEFFGSENYINTLLLMFSELGILNFGSLSEKNMAYNYLRSLATFISINEYESIALSVGASLSIDDLESGLFADIMMSLYNTETKEPNGHFFSYSFYPRFSRPDGNNVVADELPVFTLSCIEILNNILNKNK
jgi:hypothetical protein